MFYTFSVVFTCVVFSLALVMILFNVYFLLRRHFPVKVNCWFCNTWTKVEYENQNSFECPTCLQYNGFTKDGSYNRLIPEQYDVRLNHKLNYIKNSSPLRTSSNKKLCATCNYNQGLKVLHLANFEPLVPKNYDVEVEHFKKQLEKAYGLCKDCENLVQETLRAQSLKIFGNKFWKLQKTASSFLDLTKTKSKGGEKIPFVVKAIRYCIVLFAVVMVVNTVITFDSSDKNLKKLLPQFLFNTAIKAKLSINNMLKSTEDLQLEKNPIFETMSEHCSKFSEKVEKLSTQLWNRINEQYLIKHCLQTVNEKIAHFPVISENERYLINYGFTAISGLLLQLILWFCTNNKKTITKASQILSWLILVLISSNKLSGKHELLQLFLKIFCPLLIIYTIIDRTSTLKTNYNMKKMNNRKNIRSMVKEDILSDISDSDNSFNHFEKEPSFTNTLNSTKSAHLESTAETTHTLPHKNLETDLNTSLSNLDLGNSHNFFNSNISKPLLSPSRLNSITKNPWTAGGFWSNPYTYSSLESRSCNLSRSSSHSSGFGSHTNENYCFNSLPASPGNSVSGGDDQHSVFSEPAYQLGNAQFELYKTRNGAIATSLYSPNLGGFGTHNPLQQTTGGILWNKHDGEIHNFAYTSSTLNWPRRRDYTMSSLFKNRDPVKLDNSNKIRF